MGSLWVLIVMFVSLAHLRNMSLVRAEALNSLEVLEKPVRPRVFQSADELKGYLTALGRYYASAGRNRFGKRSLRSEAEVSALSPIEIYDILQNEQ